MSEDETGKTPVEAVQNGLEAFIEHSDDDHPLAERWSEHLDGLEENEIPEDLADDTLDAFEKGLQKLMD